MHNPKIVAGSLERLVLEVGLTGWPQILNPACMGLSSKSCHQLKHRLHAKSFNLDIELHPECRRPHMAAMLAIQAT